MWFKLLLPQVLTLCISAHTLRYIIPSGSSATICPGEPCHTLEQFTGTPDRYFTTGSTFVFLPGNHSLETVLYIRNVSDITLRRVGNRTLSTASIFLGKNATIICDTVTNFHIEGLRFTAFAFCKYVCREKTALIFANSDRIRISNSIFQNREVAAAVKSINSSIAVLDCFFVGNTGSFGGAIDARRGSTILVSGSTFASNEASDSGGAISVRDSDITASNGNTFTGNRARLSGGAICANHGNITLEGSSRRNLFDRNTGGNGGGGAVYCASCILTMAGNNTFLSNALLHRSEGRVGYGGAVAVSAGTMNLEFGFTVFSRNHASSGGAIAVVSSSKLSISNTTKVVLDGNKAKFGGGMEIHNSHIHTSGRGLKFVNNVATEAGGGVSIGKRVGLISFKRVVLSGTFINNTAQCGGAVDISNHKKVFIRYANMRDNSASAFCIHTSTVTFKAGQFVNNSGTFGGGISSRSSTLSFENNTSFEGNTALSGGAVYSLQGTVSFDGVTEFVRNSAGRDGGAVYAAGTVINLNRTLLFTLNSAENGGALYLKRESFLSLGLQAHFNSSFNTALGYGGGVYYLDNTDPAQCSYDDRTEYSEEVFHCFLKSKVYEVGRSLASISSFHDSAGIDGSFLFGGLLDRCRPNYNYSPFIYERSETMLQHLTTKYGILTVTIEDNETQAITSQPYGLCFCNGHDQIQDCTGSRSKVIHRGQKFTVSLLAIAQGNSLVSTSVTAITSPTASLKLLQNPQHLPRHCSNITYNLYSTEEMEVVTLYPEGPCHDTGYASVVINLSLLPCPDGFTLASDGRCVCEERLHEYNVSCTIDEDIYLTRSFGAEFWMGAEYVNGSYEGLILYRTCPVEYCRTDEVNMTVHGLDTQCAQGRIGVLCGGCAENYSLLMGSSKCRECSNTYLVLILSFGVAGIALVAFLSIFRLTVATGMINSLILYTNIVQVNRKLFFPANTVNILTVFIAWLNLDLGFETCFYDGMDAFAQTCLQFAFPVYVWVLISLIILTSRYSITMSKLIGHNPIAVLATLLLMSYTKVLKIVIEVYSSVKLDCPQNRTVTVWLKDANVPYLQSKHLVLTVVTSLVLVFLFLPYTLLLLLGHKLYCLSGRKYFHWFNKMKPLLDSYYAPYKTHTRYWTGFLLLVRCSLYIVFSFNSLGGSHESLLAIIITFTAVGFAVGFVYRGRIYRTLSVNILEASAYLNLVSLSALTLAKVANQTALVYSLVGIVFAIMLGVIVYHIYALYVEKSAILKELKGMLAAIFKNSKSTAKTVNNDLPSQCPNRAPSKTVVELREPLLEN